MTALFEIRHSGAPTRRRDHWWTMPMCLGKAVGWATTVQLPTRELQPSMMTLTAEI
ncbi:hypothetical protein PAXRUDRAFT_824040 [Paxillus rubicundulus Ve08.2h10]|uniref:Uncharacterized protein n=1 Tax=Paxillus rubicundulus Ve08.2h10 TaxID=930991 RepID=A0A0D0E868_9AGAM|nr:hypothetical protein PAXRUDRAFT_824040 [Paxillus rubicundulus Ve08.2h10]